MKKYSKYSILNKPFLPIEKIFEREFIPLSMSEYLLEHEITAFFGNVSNEVGRSIVENEIGFPIGVYYIENICITFDGCLFTDNALLSSDSLNFRESSREVLSHFLKDELTEVYVENTCVLLYGPGWTTWGHWIIEFLTRVYIIYRMGFDKNNIKWIIPSDCPDFAIKIINMVGIKDINLILFDHTNTILRCKSIIIPTNLTCGMSCHPLMSEYISWIKNILGCVVSPDPSLRLYLSRQKLATSRRVSNAEEVENIIKNNGYRVVYPESLSVSDQIHLYSKSISIFSEYGSASHNSIFASPQTFIGCLRDNKRSVGFVQSALCKAAGQKMCYIFGDHNYTNNNSEYTINPIDLKASLNFAQNKIIRSLLNVDRSKNP
ncbi:glycosyltransferase family 61 protein [Acetobacter thailandicus]|uniref:glycosyltransferase family 61 protein n=1 Tax=Acetobacter thailandicus TaxID=1502842 RepID=UPI001BADA831|nr:glycosyltransferase family 61 protein [Acetobacter thailandicus]MBS0980970.1 glycosyltransferase family 61 protein [Acetobacter thailandicus]